MTLKEKVGQLIMIGADTDINKKYCEKILKDIDSNKVGGVCFFKGKSDNLPKLINKYNFTVAARTSDSGIPVYHRVWNRENETLEIRILLSAIRKNHNSSRIRNVKRHKENDHTRAINSVWSLTFAPV